MSLFDKILKEQFAKHELISENEGGALGAGSSATGADQDAEVAVTQPSIDASTNQEQGAKIAEPANKPYLDIANTMYACLMLNYDDLSPQEKDMINSTNPQEINSDGEGTAFMDVMDKVLQRREMPDADSNIDGIATDHGSV